MIYISGLLFYQTNCETYVRGEGVVVLLLLSHNPASQLLRLSVCHIEMTSESLDIRNKKFVTWQYFTAMYRNLAVIVKLFWLRK